MALAKIFLSQVRKTMSIVLFCSGALYGAQYDDYPIIFIHGHSGNQDIEDTWIPMAKHLDGLYGYSYFGKIWEKSTLPATLPKKTMFLFGFYRDSESDSFYHVKGKIGAIPIDENSIDKLLGTELELNLGVTWPPVFGAWYKTKDVDYKTEYFDSSRRAYSDRLRVAVDKVLDATKADKVIIVTHSMGGLVARAYIRWLGGEKKVFKLLTDGTPNHGITDDNRAAIEMFVNFSHGSQQAGGEYIEMSARPSFKGKSYTDWLNDGWEKFCLDNHVRYATIAGNKDPYPLIDIGVESDGVIDRASVFLPGAEFNSVIPACHIKKFPLLLLNLDFPNDQNIVDSTFTKEAIERWIFRDEVNAGAAVTDKKTLALSPFYDKYLLQYEVSPDPVVVRILINDSQANTIVDKWIPGYSGPASAGYRHVIFDSSGWPSGVYMSHIEVYDMNGKVYDKTNLKAARLPGSGQIQNPPVLTFLNAPAWYTDNRRATFDINSSQSSTYLAYRIDGGPYSNYSLTNNKIVIDNLANGLHTLYVTGVGKGEPAIFRWMIVNPTIVTINNRVIGGAEAVTGSEVILTTGTVEVRNTGKLKLQSQQTIILGPGFKAERGSHVEATVTRNRL